MGTTVWGRPAPHVKTITPFSGVTGVFIFEFTCGHARTVDQVRDGQPGWAPVCDVHGCTGEPKVAPTVRDNHGAVLTTLDHAARTIKGNPVLGRQLMVTNATNGTAVLALSGLSTMDVAIVKDWEGKLADALKASRRHGDPIEAWMPRSNYVAYDPAKETPQQAEQRGIALDAIDLLRRFITRGGK